MKLTGKKIFLFAALLVFVVLFVPFNNVRYLAEAAKSFLGMLSPVFIGLGTAFIMNVPMRAIETRLFARFNRSGGRVWKRLRRPLALILAAGIIFGLLALALAVIIPQIRSSAVTIADNLPDYMEKLRGGVTAFLGMLGIPEEFIAERLNWDGISRWILEGLERQGTLSPEETVSMASSLVSAVYSLIIGFAISVYILMSKESLAAIMTKCIHALLPSRAAKYVLHIARLSEEVFSGFVVGQFSEALLTTVTCYLGMLLFRFPYPAMISAVVGITTFIPVAGAFISTVFGGVLILITNPVQALWFVVYAVVLQQLDGNIIYPKIVGRSVGLPGLWVLVAVTVGGELCGALGMLLGVPVCSVLYCLARELVNRQLRKKGMDGRGRLLPEKRNSGRI